MAKSTTAALQSHSKTAVKPKRRGRPPNSERPVPPTPETAAMLVPTFLRRLGEDHQRAAVRIEFATRNSGTLQRYVNELSLTGLTSNPTIFDHAVRSSETYDEGIAQGALF